MPTIDQILNIAKVCQFLAADDAANQTFLKGKYLRSPKIPRLIYIVRNSVDWLNTYNPSSSTLLGKANYLYSLCMPYVGQANVILNSGGTGTIINPATGLVSSIAFQIVQFAVGDVGAPILAGQTSFTLNYEFVLNNSVSIDLDGTELPIAVSDRISYTIAYSNPSITITFNQAVSNGQLYLIQFLQFVTV